MDSPEATRKGRDREPGRRGPDLGWYLEMPDERGSLRLANCRTGRSGQRARSRRAPGVIRANTWQHVAAVVRRGRNETLLYVNGNLVAKGALGAAQFDDPKADLQIGNISGTQPFQGELADVRLYRRPLEASEIVALVEPGKQFVQLLPRKARGRRSSRSRI